MYWPFITESHKFEELSARLQFVFDNQMIISATPDWYWCVLLKLYLLLFLHQTTTHSFRDRLNLCCILFCFYIKPQRVVLFLLKYRMLRWFLASENTLGAATKLI